MNLWILYPYIVLLEAEMGTQNRKRTGTAVLLLVALAGMAFGGGRGQQQGGASSGGKPVLVIGQQANSFITDYENNYLTQYLEKLHNVNLDFYMLPENGAEIRTKVSLMVASNDLPDIINTEALGAETILDYGAKGAFIPLNKYYNDPAMAPNFAAIPDEDKAVLLNGITSPDGNIYSFPTWPQNPWNEAPYRYYINKAWLDKLGLKIPATTNELKNVLLAFRDRDPNGNGKKDEIPLYGYFNGGYGENTIEAILNSFIFTGRRSLTLDASGNKVIAPFTYPAYRKGLVYLNALYKDGILEPSLFTDDQQQFRATLASNPPIVGLTTAGSWSNWPQADTNSNFRELALIPPFTGPDGVCYTPFELTTPVQISFITSQCKNADFAFKFLESFLNIEVSWVAMKGEEGVDWSRNPEDLAGKTSPFVEIGVVPKIDHVALKDIWAEPSNKFWHRINPFYFPWGVAQEGSVYDLSLPTANLFGLHYQLYYDKHPVWILPPLKYNLEEATKISEPVTTIQQYVKQSVAEFITGIRDINSDTAWNAYLRELDNMGLQQWLTTAQAAYNRQKR
jgi:putative aldouronate transport system substrate-binding protein